MPGSSGWRGLWAFSYTEFYVQAHEWLSVATSLVVQAVLLVFVRILAPQLLEVALLGSIVFSLFALGQRVQNEAAFIRIDHKLNQLYLASPLTAEGYFLGMSIGVLLAYLLPIAVLVGVAAELVGISLPTALLLLGVGTAIWLIASSIGYFVSTLFRDMRTIWPYASIFYNVFGVLPPVFYPITFLPVGLRTVALFLPPSAATGLLQWSVNRRALSIGQAELAGIVLVVETLVLVAFAVAWARRTVREE